MITQPYLERATTLYQKWWVRGAFYPEDQETFLLTKTMNEHQIYLLKFKEGYGHYITRNKDEFGENTEKHMKTILKNPQKYMTPIDKLNKYATHPVAYSKP